MKNCSYCGANISDLASSCPHCGEWKPFDKNLNTVKCKECNHLLKISTVLGVNGTVCPQCGFPNNKIECSVCSLGATHFDKIGKKYLCPNHRMVECNSCGKRLSVSDGFSRGSYRYDCRKCIAIDDKAFLQAREREKAEEEKAKMYRIGCFLLVILPVLFFLFKLL